MTDAKLLLGVHDTEPIQSTMGDPNVYSPAARIVCSTSILWFFVPVVWSCQVPERSILLETVWAADVFLLGAALNYWMDGTRYTWKMFLDVVAVVTLCMLGTVHAFALGGMVPYAAAVPGAVFAFCFVVNCMQVSTCGGADKVDTTWVLTFLSYRWGGLVAAIVIMSAASNSNLSAIWTSCWFRVLVVSIAYYLHNLKVWYGTLHLNRLKGGDREAFTFAALRYMLEVSAVCALCAGMKG